jgi:pentatricopeptide repeat protein
MLKPSSRRAVCLVCPARDARSFRSSARQLKRRGGANALLPKKPKTYRPKPVTKSDLHPKIADLLRLKAPLNPSKLRFLTPQLQESFTRIFELLAEPTQPLHSLSAQRHEYLLGLNVDELRADLSDVDSHNLLIDALGARGHLTEAVKVIVQMERNSAALLESGGGVLPATATEGSPAGEPPSSSMTVVPGQSAESAAPELATPDSRTYKTYIRACGAARQAEEALRTLGHMRRQGFEPEAEHYDAALLACVKARPARPDWSVELVRQMEATPGEGLATTKSYNLLAKAHVKVGDLAAARETFRHMRMSGKALDAHSFATLVTVCGREGQTEEALGYLEEMQQEGLEVTRDMFNALIKACAKRRDWSRNAITIIERMEAEGVEPDLSSYNNLLLACATDGDPRLAERAFEQLLGRGAEAGLQPSTVSFNSLINSYAKAALVTRAERTARWTNQVRQGIGSWPGDGMEASVRGWRQARGEHDSILSPSSKLWSAGRGARQVGGAPEKGRNRNERALLLAEKWAAEEVALSKGLPIPGEDEWDEWDWQSHGVGSGSGLTKFSDVPKRGFGKGYFHGPGGDEQWTEARPPTGQLGGVGTGFGVYDDDDDEAAAGGAGERRVRGRGVARNLDELDEADWEDEELVWSLMEGDDDGDGGDEAGGEEDGGGSGGSEGAGGELDAHRVWREARGQRPRLVSAETGEFVDDDDADDDEWVWEEGEEGEYDGDWDEQDGAGGGGGGAGGGGGGGGLDKSQGMLRMVHALGADTTLPKNAAGQTDAMTFEQEMHELMGESLEADTDAARELRQLRVLLSQVPLVLTMCAWMCVGVRGCGCRGAGRVGGFVCTVADTRGVQRCAAVGRKTRTLADLFDDSNYTKSYLT